MSCKKNYYTFNETGHEIVGFRDRSVMKSSNFVTDLKYRDRFLLMVEQSFHNIFVLPFLNHRPSFSHIHGSLLQGKLKS